MKDNYTNIKINIHQNIAYFTILKSLIYNNLSLILIIELIQKNENENYKQTKNIFIFQLDEEIVVFLSVLLLFYSELELELSTGYFGGI